MTQAIGFKKAISACAFCVATLNASSCLASDSFTSEFSHLASGAAMAGYITHIYAESDHRAWIGFGISTAVIVAEQNYEIRKNGRRSSQQLDMVAHALGSALGAWYADKYLILPNVTQHAIGFTLYIPIK